MTKTALNTGANCGIGRGITCIHVEKAGDAIITALEEEALYELKKELEKTPIFRITT